MSLSNLYTNARELRADKFHTKEIKFHPSNSAEVKLSTNTAGELLVNDVPVGGGGGVASVSAGTNIAVSGTPTDPIVGVNITTDLDMNLHDIQDASVVNTLYLKNNIFQTSVSSVLFANPIPLSHSICYMTGTTHTLPNPNTPEDELTLVSMNEDVFSDPIAPYAFFGSANTTVSAMVLKGTILYLAGNWGGVRNGLVGTTATPFFCSYDTATGLFANLGASSLPTTSAISFLIDDPTDNNMLYFCGSFTTLNDGAVDAHRCGRYNIATNTISSMGLSGIFPLGSGAIDGTVSSMVCDANYVYICGSFTAVANYNGVSVVNVANTRGVGKWNKTTAQWEQLHAVSAITGGTSICSSLAINGTNLYIGGDFTSISLGANTGYLTRYNTTTLTYNPVATINFASTDTNLGPVAVQTLKLNGNTLHIGGIFTHVNTLFPIATNFPILYGFVDCDVSVPAVPVFNLAGQNITRATRGTASSSGPVFSRFLDKDGRVYATGSQSIIGCPPFKNTTQGSGVLVNNADVNPSWNTFGVGLPDVRCGLFVGDDLWCGCFCLNGNNIVNGTTMGWSALVKCSPANVQYVVGNIYQDNYLRDTQLFNTKGSTLSLRARPSLDGWMVMDKTARVLALDSV